MLFEIARLGCFLTNGGRFNHVSTSGGKVLPCPVLRITWGTWRLLLSSMLGVSPALRHPPNGTDVRIFFLGWIRMTRMTLWPFLQRHHGLSHEIVPVLDWLAQKFWQIFHVPLWTKYMNFDWFAFRPVPSSGQNLNLSHSFITDHSCGLKSNISAVLVDMWPGMGKNQSRSRSMLGTRVSGTGEDTHRYSYVLVFRRRLMMRMFFEQCALIQVKQNCACRAFKATATLLEHVSQFPHARLRVRPRGALIRHHPTATVNTSHMGSGRRRTEKRQADKRTHRHIVWYDDC